MNKPHKHAAIIKAWADGAEIEFKVKNGHWARTDKSSIGWYDDFEYRIKPVKKTPTEVFINSTSVDKTVHPTPWLTKALKAVVEAAKNGEFD